MASSAVFAASSGLAGGFAGRTGLVKVADKAQTVSELSILVTAAIAHMYVMQIWITRVLFLPTEYSVAKACIGGLIIEEQLNGQWPGARLFQGCRFKVV